LFVFQHAGLRTDFQTPFALQPVIAPEQTRATQALGLVPAWHFFSQSAFICEQDPRAVRQPSCAMANSGAAAKSSAPNMTPMIVFIVDLPFIP
jgi:hypothetical protein